jgi:hypothetical protein
VVVWGPACIIETTMTICTDGVIPAVVQDIIEIAAK